MRFSVKKKCSLALVALIIFALTLPALALAQQKRAQSNTSAGSTTTGKPGPTTATPNRRPRVHTPVNSPAAVEQDFSEALVVIQENYIDGNKLDYNNVFKSSITGMLRTLDPHSNYFDREEFDEMKTDQRSEYYGIGASILNYATGDSVDTYITATFDNSPAAAAGLRFADPIDAVDGVTMHARSTGEVRFNICGHGGSCLQVKITW